MNMMDEKTYSGLILCNEPKKSNHFKSFLRSSSFFTILNTVDPSELLNDTYFYYRYDYIFLSDELSEGLLGDIKTKIELDPISNKKPKIILYSLRDNIPRVKLIKSLFGGASSFIVSPFTLQALSDACNFNDKISSINSSHARLKVAVKMMIQDSVDESDSPSMVHKIPEDVKNYFKELGDKKLSNNLIEYLSNLNHKKRINSYDAIHLKVKNFLKDGIKTHLGL